MGYSCTKAASDTLHAVHHLFNAGKNQSTLLINGTEYFFERGRENGDGAITGTLMEMLPNDYCRKAGSVRIDGEGKIARFPGLTFADRQKVAAFVKETPGTNPRLWSQVCYGGAL
jgi:hypothetical protein